MGIKDYPTSALLEELKERIGKGTPINLALKGGTIDVDRYGQISVSIETEAGAIIGSVDCDLITGAGYDAVYLSIEPKMEDTEVFDLVDLRVKKNEDHSIEVVQYGLADLVGGGIPEKIAIKKELFTEG